MVEFDDARWGRRVGYLEERLVKMTDSK